MFKNNGLNPALSLKISYNPFFFFFQYTEEKLGNAEKTEFDGHYESLIQQYESTKLWTEKLMTGAQAVLIPNPGTPHLP